MPDASDAARAIEDGALVVFPTDTVYGLACRPDLPSATGKVFEAKGRPRELTLPVLCASLEQAERVAAFDDRARRLAGRFWPGGLTLVLPRTALSRPWDLGGEAATVGVRVPAHRLALEVLNATGPLATTSANRSGRPTPAECAGVRAELGEAVRVYLCDDPRPEGPPSTVVGLVGSEPRILRDGAIPREALFEALR